MLDSLNGPSTVTDELSTAVDEHENGESEAMQVSEAEADEQPVVEEVAVLPRSRRGGLLVLAIALQASGSNLA